MKRNFEVVRIKGFEVLIVLLVVRDTFLKIIENSSNPREMYIYIYTKVRFNFMNNSRELK